jgi:hypothetical protein
MKEPTVSRCRSCSALINRNWSACLVCRQSIMDGSAMLKDGHTVIECGHSQLHRGVGKRILIQSMSGTHRYGIVLAQSLEVAPLKPGRWYWVRTETGDTWVHESLVKGS